MSLIIYKVTNKINGKSYIGQTSSLIRRKAQHRWNSEKNNGISAFHAALRKYGWNNFSWEILCECRSKHDLSEKERYYIKEMNTLSPYGYNMSIGGEQIPLGYKQTEEHKAKTRVAHLGCKESDVTKDRKRVARLSWLKTHNISKETRKNISKSKRKYNDDIVFKSFEMRESGMLYTEIAKELNINVGTLKSWKKKNWYDAA